jgi:hypothetical protein
MRIFRFSSVTIYFLAVMTITAEAAPGDCYLRVAGKTYLDGRCNVMMDKSGDFSIGMVDTGKPSKYFASVTVIDASTGKGEGLWNGIFAESHAQDTLGKLSRLGGCWVNEVVKVCAWKLGTKPSRF